ncbi:MAG: hypothetical protein SF066_01230 [Thermoanaerobaculia bacterium]|nr:hypothetical protein [Thermoanaerobaculia bacterium]
MKHFLSAIVLALVVSAGVATAEAPQDPIGNLETTTAEAAAPTLEEIFAIEDAKVLATTYSCWVFCDDGSQTLVNVSGLLKCGATARNFCGAQACEFVFNNRLFTC